MKCRHCGKLLIHTFLDLGHAPPSNAYLNAEDLNKPEIHYPLKIKVCDNCWLVQTEDYAKADSLFTSEYAYFSSTSLGWLTHSKIYAQRMINELSLNKLSLVVEIASNDGYLLKNFVKESVPCIGIEPTDSTADAAEKLGIPVIREFFGEFLGRRLAKEGKKADLIIGNNVFAHVPDINDFTLGLKALLKDGGIITLEFPHLMRLIEQVQFDTVYHEHFSYLSLQAAIKIFSHAGLRIWHVEELPTHGGSLRLFVCHIDDSRETQISVARLLKAEVECGLLNLQTYLNFQPLANKIKDDLLDFLIHKKLDKKRVVAYGAAAKGNTLLNYAGIKSDLLNFVCDAAPAKQGKFMPGSHIPIFTPEAIQRFRPDYILILPWNISEEVVIQLQSVREYGGKFVTAVPTIKVF